jgi:hypothetical protein
MSRFVDMLVVGVTWIISIVIHIISIELFAPGTPLHELATGVVMFDGGAKADLWHEILAVWVPLIAAAGICAWAFIREYRRQRITRRRPPV